jgi:hypothetical protein
MVGQKVQQFFEEVVFFVGALEGDEDQVAQVLVWICG